jgi:hypothetical protein
MAPIPSTTQLEIHASSGLYLQSDKRIKCIAGLSDAASDLGRLMGIEVTDYTYIDTLAKGSGQYKPQRFDRLYWRPADDCGEDEGAAWGFNNASRL